MRDLVPMLRPFQCLLYCAQNEHAHFLIAAAGSSLNVIDVNDGNLLCSWPPSHKEDGTSGTQDGFVPPRIDDASQAGPDLPPFKRRKLSASRASSSSTEIVVHKQHDPLPSPAFIKLAVSKNGKYVVAITGEDKCIHVFELSPVGLLSPYSERTMPKRPCALVLTADDMTILCADKFGDVYALPLLGKAFEVGTTSDADVDPLPEDRQAMAQPFVPRANVLTVHTQRNRKSLSQQQKSKSNPTAKKTVAFEHQLVLGHVSLLTDIACVSLPASGGRLHDYIVTSDRDEHIRVSRGLPQAYITEVYCLGHTSFISKLCFSSSLPNLLISAGGDNALFLWDWPSGHLLQRANISTIVKDLRRPSSNRVDESELQQKDRSNEVENIAVSKLLMSQAANAQNDNFVEQLWVIIEGVPAILLFVLTNAMRLDYVRAYRTDNNVIDIVSVPILQALFYSSDPTHAPFSATKVAVEQAEQRQRTLGALAAGLDGYESQEISSTVDEVVETADRIAAKESHSHLGTKETESLQDMLYGLRNLRKRNDED